MKKWSERRLRENGVWEAGESVCVSVRHIGPLWSCILFCFVLNWLVGWCCFFWLTRVYPYVCCVNFQRVRYFAFVALLVKMKLSNNKKDGKTAYCRLRLCPFFRCAILVLFLFSFLHLFVGHVSFSASALGCSHFSMCVIYAIVITLQYIKKFRSSVGLSLMISVSLPAPTISIPSDFGFYLLNSLWWHMVYVRMSKMQRACTFIEARNAIFNIFSSRYNDISNVWFCSHTNTFF